MTFDEMIGILRPQKLPVYAVTMIRDGRIRTEQLTGANACNDCYSISKNFTATAIGMLIDRGMLSLDTTVPELFAKEYPSLCTGLWKDCTVRHLLTQTTGIADGFLDIDTEDARDYGGDYLRFALEHPPVQTPGEAFCYSDSNFYLLSRVFAKASGEKMQEFLQRELFVPMEFQGQAWALCAHGHAMGGTGLFLRVPDMAKLGWLYLCGGVYHGRRLLSEAFCRQATALQVPLGGDSGYGFSFWKDPHHETEFYCGGMYHQAVRVYPETGTVIAWQSYDPEGKAGHVSALADACGRGE